MEKQLKINYSSAYLKTQLLRSPWFINERAVQSNLKTIHDFLLNKVVLDEKYEEPQLTIPYSVQLKKGNSFEQGKHIAVIPINGSLMKYDYCGAPGMQSIGNRIRQAEEAESVAGILLHIDSPGGTVDGTQELGEIVKNCSKPIVAFADGLMASAAYWIGSQADTVIAKDTTTEVGSIGVVLSFVDIQKAMEEKGYVFHDIFADQSSEKWKDMLDAKKGDYATIKEQLLNPLADEFQNTIKETRPNVKDKALRGRVYLSRQAKKLGLIDKIGSFDFAVNELNKLINNKSLNIMVKEAEVKDEKGFIDKILAAVKPEIKDISEDTKADYESKLKELSDKNADLEKTIAGFEELAEENKEKIEKSESELIEANGKFAALTSEYDNLKEESEELRTKLTKKVVESEKVKVDEDKLEIGTLNSDEADWAKEASKFKEIY